MANWKYEGKEILELKDLPENLQNSFGFIYKISLQYEGKDLVYYGQKTIKTDAKRIIGIRELKERGKKPFRKYKSKRGDKKGQWIYYEEAKEETWKDYNSSSDLVKELIEQGVPYTKEILEFTSRALLNYKEYSWILCEKCMETEDCLNLRVGNFQSRNIIKALKKEK